MPTCPEFGSVERIAAGVEALYVDVSLASSWWNYTVSEVVNKNVMLISHIDLRYVSLRGQARES